MKKIFADIIYKYGEERFAKSIAKKILNNVKQKLLIQHFELGQ